MENILQLASQIYAQYMNEVILGLGVCVFLLMIIALRSLRKCRTQIRQLSERTRELTKAALNTPRQQIHYGSGQKEIHVLAERRDPGIRGNAKKVPETTKEKEELFGSVIQEIFP